jgi:hypothetical protein
VTGWTLSGESLYVSHHPGDKLVVLTEGAAPQKATPMPGTGAVRGVIGDQLVLIVDDKVVLQSMKNGTTTPVPMAESAGAPLVADGALWYAQPHPKANDDDEETFDLLMYVP